MSAMLRRFLMPQLRKDMRILSVGCGMGSDVVCLRDAGYQAFGLDPSRLALDSLPGDYHSFFRIGAVEERPFGHETFDFIYALDVIEHVGCVNFGTKVTGETEAVRVAFISACLEMLAPGGSLLLTTSNRYFPVDPGHWHGYHWFGRLFKGREKLGISLPWSSKNFLVSVGDVKRLVCKADGSGVFDVRALPAADYPTIAERRSLKASVVNAGLRLVDMPLLRGSFLSPVLVIGITKAN